MRKLVVGPHDKSVKRIPRVHPVVGRYFGLLLRENRLRRLADLLHACVAQAPGFPAVGNPEFDNPWTSEHGESGRLHQTHVIALYPELINRIGDLKRKAELVGLHKLDSRKPSLEGIAADPRLYFGRYFIPNFAIALFHNNLSTRSPLRCPAQPPLYATGIEEGKTRYG